MKTIAARNLAISS